MNAFELDELQQHADGMGRHPPGMLRIFESLVAENKRLKSKLLRMMIENQGCRAKLIEMREENKRMKRILDAAQLSKMFTSQAG